MAVAFPDFSAMIWGSVSLIAFGSIPLVWAFDQGVQFPRLPEWAKTVLWLAFGFLAFPWAMMAAAFVLYGSFYVFALTVSGFDPVEAANFMRELV